MIFNILQFLLGIAPGQWADKYDPDQDWNACREWYDYLKAAPGGDRYLDMYHPWMIQQFEGVKLDEFFG